MTIPEGVVEIGSWAFANCKTIKSITIPESVTTIGSQAFAGCTNLVIKTTIPKEEWPTGWADGWFGDATVEVVEIEEEEDENAKDKDKDRRR